MTIYTSIPIHNSNPMPQDPGPPPATDPAFRAAIPPRQVPPPLPGTALLRRLEGIAYNLPPVVQNRKAIAWMAAIPLALGAFNCANGNYLASVPCFVTGASVLGAVLFWTVFYPPAMITPQMLNRLFPDRA